MANLNAVSIVVVGLVLGGYWAYQQPSDTTALTSKPMQAVSFGGHSYPVCSSALRRNCVVDGDTFYTSRDKIRIADIDTPETHPPRCASEADLGDRATRRLSELLSTGAFEMIRAGRDEDRYGRKLRIILRDGRSIGDILVSEGLARTWTGRREPWCGQGDSFG